MPVIVAFYHLASTRPARLQLPDPSLSASMQTWWSRGAAPRSACLAKDVFDGRRVHHERDRHCQSGPHNR